MNGITEWMNRLSALPGKISGAALSAAQASAEAAAEGARELVPVRTGALRASIAAAPLPNGALIRADRPYAAQVELGSLHTAPHPYLLPAARRVDYPARAARAVQEVIL